MKSYLLGVLAASILAILVTQISPDGERGGIAKHIRLITSLFLICTLLSPIQALIQGLPNLINGIRLPDITDSAEQPNYQEQLDEALRQASKDYFTDMLAQTLCADLSLSQEDLRCHVSWDADCSELTPTRVTVMLSGRAIWKDPAQIRSLVSTLIGCPCDVIIE